MSAMIGTRRAAILGSSPFPGAYNVQGAWLAQVKANWPTKDILILGDSTTRGSFAGEDGTGKVNLSNHAVPAALVPLLAARGYTVRADAWFGDGQGTAGLIADFRAQNTYNSVGTSWSILTSPAEAVGGAYIRDNSGTDPMVLSSPTPCDRYLVYYRRATSGANIQIDSETALTKDLAVALDGTSNVQVLPITSTVGVGVHIFSHNRISGDNQVLGVEPRRSAGGEKRILNLGRGGNSAGLAANSATLQSALPALKIIIAQRTKPLVIINLGINDQNSAVSTDDYKTAMQAVIDAVVLAGGIPMLLGHHGTSTTPSAAYLQARRELAATNGIPVLDLSYYFTWAALQAVGFTFDGSSHLNAAGYGALAAVLDNFLAWVVR